jgi:High potential iron-sulfur protein
MTVPTGITRRNVLQAAALLAPLAVVGCSSTAQVATPELRATDPVARSLLYYPNTLDVPAASPLAARHQPDQKCAGCINVRGVAGDPLRPCPIFPGKLVNANGWCSLWAAG